jgi:dienelactone hydrolase
MPNSNITFGEAGPDFLYSKLGNEVPQRYGIAVLSVLFRHSGQVGGVEQQTHDLMAALSWINTAATNNPPPVVLMGWSMGGASVVRSAGQWAQHQSPLKIQHVLTIAGQPVLDDGKPAGAKHLPQGCGITICHGTGDTSLSPECADWLLEDAAQRAACNAGINVKMFPGEHHGISSMYNWLMQGRLPAGMTGAQSRRPLVEDLFGLTGGVA